jgi:hypothetical protein
VKRIRPAGFWSSAKVQAVVRLANEGRLSWDAAAKKINAMTPGISALPQTRIAWRAAHAKGTHSKAKVRSRKARRTRKVASQ